MYFFAACPRNPGAWPSTGFPRFFAAAIFARTSSSPASTPGKFIISVRYLTEMMNFPGVLAGDEDVLAKIAAAKNLGKPVDGHAPGLRGQAAKKYIDAGISTDHECITYEQALEK